MSPLPRAAGGGTPRPRARPRIAAALLAGSVALGLAVVGAAGVAAWDGRRLALREAGRELQNLSFILADHSDSALQALDIAIGAVLEGARGADALADAEAFARWARTQGAHVALRERADILPQAEAMIVLDAAGRVLATSREWPSEPVDSTDREYFRALRAGAPRIVGAPVRNRGSGAWALHVGRRIEGADGRFLGVVAGVVELAYFERLYGQFALGRDSAVTLYSLDGRMLVRSPRIEAALGGDFSATERFRLVVARPDGSAVQARGIDGAVRLFSGRDLRNFPVRAQVSVPVQEVLAAWRTAAMRIASGAALLLAVLGAAVAAALRAIRSEAAAADHRLALEAAASAQHAEFRQAIEGMSQGVWKLDGEGRLVLANERCAAVIGAPRDALRPGTTLGALSAAAQGPGAAGLREVLERLEGLVAAGQTASFLQDMPDARTIAVLHHPVPGGGSLTTFEDVTERHAAEARIRHMARHDALTGLANRATLNEGLEEALRAARAASPPRHLAVLYMDLDRFKAVNDTLGHPVGDALLRTVAARILRGVRSERCGGDLVARIGGDEFAIMLRSGGGDTTAARADAGAVAARIVRMLSEPFELDGHEVQIGATVGIALHPEDGANAGDLLRAADLALYAAKAEGRGRHRFFEPAMEVEVRERRAIELDLRRTLLDGDRSEMAIYFQPIVDIPTRRPTACEALVRWHRPGHGRLFSPAEFVPVAEEANLILQLGEVVLRRACAEAAAWPDTSLRLAVNLSPAQFHAPGLVELVSGALAASGLDPRRLELEVTEGVLLRRTAEVLATMHRLRTLGVRFAMDDFGTGYSSLSYLRSFPFDHVKIDRDFVRDIEAHPGDAAIVRAATGLCAEIGMTTVAEGVETEAQLRILAAAGCREAQGYLFGAPVRGEEIVGLLQRLGAAARPVVAAE